MYYEYNEEIFTKDCEEKYYLLGLIAADGYISKKNNRIEICLAEKDKEYLENIKNIVCSKKTLKYKQKQKAYRFTIDNKIIKEEIMKYINTTDKTLYLSFPYGINDLYIKDFIRGYMDGDGNIGVKKGQRLIDSKMKYYFGLRLRILGTRNFLNGLHMNLKRIINLKFDVYPHKKGTENVYYLEYSFKSAKKVLEYLYSDSNLCLKRKKEVFQSINASDSDSLSKFYNTDSGHYNTQGCEVLSSYKI